jgi:hypothetical protein
LARHGARFSGRRWLEGRRLGDDRRWRRGALELLEGVIVGVALGGRLCRRWLPELRSVGVALGGRLRVRSWLLQVRSIGGPLGRRELDGRVRAQDMRGERGGVASHLSLPGRAFGSAPFTLGSVALTFLLGALRRGL